MKAFLLGITCLLLFTACDALSGEDGEQGPQGPPGVANIQVVEFSINASSFDVASSGGSTIETQSVGMPEITSEIASGGLVLGYTDIGGGAWYAMPFVLPVPSATASLSYFYEAGTFNVSIFNDTLAPIASVFDGNRVKVVIIPPAEVPAASGIDNSDINQVLNLVN